MDKATDFIGHIGIEPALDDRQRELLERWRLRPRAGGEPPLSCGWVPSQDGASLVVDGDEKHGDAADWLRHLIRLVVKPAGLVAEGAVVGCRRDTQEIWLIHVRGNRVTQRPLWPRTMPLRQPRQREPEPMRAPMAKVIDLASRRAQG